ncbi:G-protein beta WD-40 repeat-containing protein [Artemisia annua]|uniref:G-protein beta WD-40 repeat-containing protein n=1 Tax=Artemisia annua TaxID=35608 RepID=A0A2U1PQL5_ARTAN|nr:G-protein beta WD-40 repeat-containing protein [Artemisia annua]
MVVMSWYLGMQEIFAMHRVGIAGSASNSVRPRKEKRFTYVLNDADDNKHCAGVNCLAVLKPSQPDNSSYLFTGSRDGTLKRWELSEEDATCSATFESHVDWVNDAVLAGGNTLVSCSSDTTIKTWDSLSNGTCTRTFRQHSDYVTCLAAAERNSNIVASGGMGGEVFLWDLEAALAPLNKSSEAADDDRPSATNGSGSSVPVTSLRTISSSNSISLQANVPQGYVPIAAKGHKESVYALAMNETGNLLVSGGTEKVPVYKEPTLSIDGIPGIVQCEIMNNRRHVLTKDNAGSVKLWEITRGVCIQNYGPVSFEKKKEELFEMVSIPAWFSVDSKLGNLSVHLDTPQCFSAEMYSADLNITEKAEDDKVNLARETLKGLLAHWLSKKKHKPVSQSLVNGEIPSGRDISTRSITLSKVEADGNAENDCAVYPPFEFSTVTPPSIITEGSHNGQWRKKITEMDGTEDEKDLPWWVLDCILHNRMPPREHTK